ncbi:MAG TPA: prepilin-type N-terminal cleavage/methylation domain-containing protein [Stenomitos sp.]
MRSRQSGAGFTLVEVMVAATLIATVLIGMSSVMMNYTNARTKISGLAVSQNIVQSEIDDVLMHTQVENSLISDTQGRSRPVYLENGSASVLVSNYWYLNFPRFPDGKDHNSPGQTWGLSVSSLISRFASPPGDLFTSGGGLLEAANPEDDDVAYIARLQLYGSLGSVTNVETYINGATSSANPHGQYVDTITRPSYLIADTCTNQGGASIDNSDSDPNFNNYRVKILVVRLYEKKQFFDSNGNRASFIKPAGGSKPEITHSYAVLNGKIRL